MLTRLDDDTYVDPSHVAIVRTSMLDDTQTVIFTPGSDPVSGGHLIDLPVEEVVKLLNESEVQSLAESLIADAEEAVDQS